MSDRLSVIIPNYGDSDVLPRAIMSVCDAAPGAEVIVVDNEGVNKWELPSASVDLRVVQRPRQPAGHNRNAGLDLATREFVLFCDADDEVVSGGVEPRVQALQTGFDVAVGDPVYVEADGDRRDHLGEPEPDPATAYLRQTWVPVVGCPLVRRSVFEDVRFPEWLDRAQDFALWVQVFARFDVKYVPEPVYYYHQGDGQQSRQGLPRRYACQVGGALRAALSDPGLTRPALRRAVRAGWIATKHGLRG